jgi:hypothetical protein
MTKKLIPQTEEWGNIELPGLSDEKLLNTNWNKVEGNKRRFSNSEERQKQSEKLKKKYQDDEYKKFWKEQNAKSMETRNRVDSSNKQWLQNVKDAVNESYKDPKRLEVLNKAFEKRSKDPKWKEIRQQVGDMLCKRIHTPQGVFESRKQASEHYKVSYVTLGRWIKSKPNEFYYID